MTSAPHAWAYRRNQLQPGKCAPHRYFRNPLGAIPMSLAKSLVDKPLRRAIRPSNCLIDRASAYARVNDVDFGKALSSRVGIMHGTSSSSASDTNGAPGVDGGKYPSTGSSTAAFWHTYCRGVKCLTLPRSLSPVAPEAKRNLCGHTS